MCAPSKVQFIQLVTYLRANTHRQEIQSNERLATALVVNSAYSLGN